jgi:hypothetical protein
MTFLSDFRWAFSRFNRPTPPRVLWAPTPYRAVSSNIALSAPPRFWLCFDTSPPLTGRVRWTRHDPNNPNNPNNPNKVDTWCSGAGQALAKEAELEARGVVETGLAVWVEERGKGLNAAGGVQHARIGSLLLPEALEIASRLRARGVAWQALRPLLSGASQTLAAVEEKEWPVLCEAQRAEALGWLQGDTGFVTV